MKYFTIELKAKSEQELQKRIVDNEKKGFELVKTHTKTTEGNVWQDKGRGNGLYGRVGYEFRGTDSYTSYLAIMRRDNTEYLKSKGLLAQ